MKPRDGWARRLLALLQRRRQMAKDKRWSTKEIERDVRRAIAEVRKARQKRRRR